MKILNFFLILNMLVCIVQAGGTTLSTQKKQSPVDGLLAGKTVEVTVTAFCHCSKCCGIYADGITASGVPVEEGVTIAASRAIPFGTKLEIEGVGVRVVQDRLAMKYDSRIDIYFDSHQKALEFGIKKLKVRVVQ